MPHIDQGGESTQPLIDNTSSSYSDYSTTVIRSHSRQSTANAPPSLSSILTVRPIPDPNASILPVDAAEPHIPTGPTDSMLSIATFVTARSSIAPSVAAATEGGSTIRSIPMVHRFTLIKPGAKRTTGQTQSASPGASPKASGDAAGWNPLDLLFSSGLLVAKCDICAKRLGWKPVLECDDCGLRSVQQLLVGSLILTSRQSTFEMRRSSA